MNMVKAVVGIDRGLLAVNAETLGSGTNIVGKRLKAAVSLWNQHLL